MGGSVLLCFILFYFFSVSFLSFFFFSFFFFFYLFVFPYSPARQDGGSRLDLFWLIVKRRSGPDNHTQKDFHNLCHMAELKI